ncbi:MAG: CpXC domain-containing protein [Ktedonobacterales bacterium]
MPRSSQVTFNCPCGETFTSTTHHTVNITLEPRLLYELLAGKLNVAVCPNCGRASESTLPFIYHDMARGLFAYVHPNPDADDEDREALLARLRGVYTEAVTESERLTQPQQSQRASASDDITPKQTPDPFAEPSAPPMQVIFGIEQLVTLVDSLLEPEERLGRVALTLPAAARSAGAARERVLTIARQMADQLGCFVAAEEEDGEYTVWIYGPRAQVERLAQALRPSAGSR